MASYFCLMNFKWLLIAIIFFLPQSTFAQYRKIKQGVWEGTASYYHNKFNGRLTANGETFSNSKMTAANNFLKLGTWVRVTNTKNGKSVVVKINDRMNKRNRRLIDMSRAAAEKLGYINAGLGNVKMEVLPGYKKGKRKLKKKKQAVAKVPAKRHGKISLKERVFKFPAWAKVVLKYEKEMKLQAKYISGAHIGQRKDSMFSVTATGVEANKSYRIMVLSRAASALKIMNIIPGDEAGMQIASARYYAMVQSKTEEAHFIFNLNYDVPVGTKELRFEWETESYEGISEEDFVLFVLEE